MSDLELHTELQDYRRKITRGEPVSDDELRLSIRKLQIYRKGAMTTLESAVTKTNKAAAKTKEKAQKQQDATNLLDGLL